MPSLKSFLGTASIVAGQKSITINNAVNGNSYGIKLPDGTRVEVYTVPASGTYTTAQVAASLLAQLVNTKAPEFADLQFSQTATDNVIYAVHNNPYSDFDFVAAGTVSAVTVATVQATTGPGDWGNAANWSGSSLPTDGDSILVSQPFTQITQRLDALAGVAIDKFYLNNRANYGFGLPPFRTAGTILVREYLPRFVVLKTLGTFVVDGDGDGPQVANLKVLGNAGTGNATADVSSNYNTPNFSEAPINLMFLGSGNVANVTRGLVGLPFDPVAGTRAVFNTVRVGRESDRDEAPEVWNDGTVTTLYNFGGKTRGSQAIGQLYMHREAVEHDQTFGGLTANVLGGTLIYRPDDTLNVTANGPAAVVDLSRSVLPKTIDPGSFWSNGAKCIDPHGRAGNIRDLFDAVSLKASTLGD